MDEQKDDFGLAQAEFWINWHIAGEGRMSNGHKVVFRRNPYTFDAPGVEMQSVHGKDRDGAIRNFAAQLKEK